MDYSAPKDTSVTTQNQDSCCPHLLHYAKLRCCNSRGKGNCRSFNKSQWNKGPIRQLLLLLNICQNVIS